MVAYVTLSSKGQLVIPAAMRDELALATGQRFEARIVDGRIVLSRVPDLDELSATVTSWTANSGGQLTGTVDEYYQSHRDTRE